MALKTSRKTEKVNQIPFSEGTSPPKLRLAEKPPKPRLPNLSTLRKKSGQSITEIRNTTNIPLNIIKCIESRSYGDLKLQPIYVKMFIRLYTQQIGAETAPFLQDFDAWCAAHPRNSKTVRFCIEDQKGKQLSPFFVLLYACLSLLFISLLTMLSA